jgi:hypothetical protein
VQVKHAGVHLSVNLGDKRGICIQWGIDRDDRAYPQMDDVALIPASYQNAMLVSRDNMRS